MVTGDPPSSARAGQLSGQLHRARERGFVGRTAEIRSFAESLTGSSDVRLHFVHGPGGIGKTTLLDAFARHAVRAGRRPVYLDARDVACTAEAVTAAIAERSVRSGATPGDPQVLLIDGYELLTPVDRWIREELLPSLPYGSVTVLAGRAAPPTPWWLDVGWRQLIDIHQLTALDGDDSDALLAGLGVDGPHRTALARLGRGHPLVLAMLAEAGRSGNVPTQLADAPDVVGRLCALIVDDVPDAAHRAGLATCAHATRMTQDLLARIVGARAPEVWAWLESRAYVRRGAIGLFLHDVVRELFEAEFIHRSPDGYSALHVAVRGYFLQRLLDPAEPRADRAAAEILLLHRSGPLATETAVLRERGLPPISLAGPGDSEAIFALIQDAEGAESAELARRWAGEQPRSLYRSRSDNGVESFSMHVYLPVSGGLESDDPVAAAILRAVGEHGALRPGERIHINRFSGATGSYQRDPMVLLAGGVSCLLEWAHQPAAWTFIVPVDHGYFGRYFEYLGMSPMVRLRAFGRDIVGYGWDRRRFPVTGLFDLMARRELSGEVGPPPDDQLRPAPMSRNDFAVAVRDALVHAVRPDRLSRSPLLGSALVDPAAADPAEALRATVLAAIGALGDERRGAEHRRVLERTYLKGARSQEAAAELLDLPFSTYRRHLGQAQQRLIEILWAVEIGERPGFRPDRSGQQVDGK
ncbi:ATP-binding protein [Nakamurella lactea]|uniref:ATP-binding protein n=1 Tax=Nakamurella lactea TaxID=459515 RepID=UPI00040A4CF0|nr:ATP-binding protein [Nakamurella lactea]